jgi:hypothetical protein
MATLTLRWRPELPIYGERDWYAAITVLSVVPAVRAILLDPVSVLKGDD